MIQPYQPQFKGLPSFTPLVLDKPSYIMLLAHKKSPAGATKISDFGGGNPHITLPKWTDKVYTLW